ncbi:hypothetical protein MSAN_01070500 [Mycena sanguinolenta]|uniref:C2H2-type domain-containing protein n=1 Tax=Mycena sanguinolenta TaxID=230812 RepID=A0A8H6YUI0_9AGAR|nr:hypothetical protein MSAN_01070500 [Mycena sanguinolenta]
MGPVAKRQTKSTITISPESVVDLSKSVLLPMLCSALVASDPESKSGSFKPCGQILNCWKAFNKHQIKHSSVRKGYNGVQYVCHLTSCTAKLHNSLSSLKSHIMLVHMKQCPLPCPLRTCTRARFSGSGKEQFTTFSRDRDLVEHFENSHNDLLGQAVDLYSTVLFPRWDPFPTTKSAIRPPPLPPSSSLPPGSLFIQQIIVNPTPHFTQLISAESGFLPTAHTLKPTPPRGRRRLLASTALDAQDSFPSPQSDSSHYEFADLPRHDAMLPLPPFMVQKIGEGLGPRRDLVRPLPQPSWTWGDKPPPATSIFYEALRKQVYAQYAEGEGAAADEDLNSAS